LEYSKKMELSRKERTEKLLEKKGVKINYNLPPIEPEEEIILRTPKEIAERVSVLAIINLVAFSSLPEEKATEYLKMNNLWGLVTPNEKEFLKEPTDEKKNKESWKAEGIWTLMWALKIVDNLGVPDQMCDLNQISADDYPIGNSKDPNSFIQKHSESRTKAEILDANDLYYRMYWTCVNTRLNRHEINGLNSGVVYERYYALNWLINYMDEEWDNISCDT
jgi:hypothetical protein